MLVLLILFLILQFYLQVLHDMMVIQQKAFKTRIHFFVSMYRLLKCTNRSLVLPLLLKTTSLVCKVLLAAFTKLRKINSLVGLARQWMF